MPIYRYRAVSAAGEVAVGELDAANEGEIVDRLRDQGLMPMQIAHATGAIAAGAAAAKGGKPRRRLFESKTVTRDQLLALTRELATLLLELTGSKLAIQYEPAGPTFVKNRVGSTKRAESELGFRAATPLREGLRALIEWRLSHKAEVARRRQAARSSS